MHQMKYRLGFDIGSTSLGWACIMLDDNDQPCGIHDFGVRIFPSGRNDKTKAPTSVERRQKRGARRNRDRYLKRRQRLLEAMIRLGLQPTDSQQRQQLAKLEPLALRAQGVEGPLTLHQLGRAIFHLNQHRGFKSNRIAERSKENEEAEKGLKAGISNLSDQLQEHNATLGQWLFKRLQNGQATRLKASEDSAERWTSRRMLEDEYDTLMAEQKKHHPTTLTDDVIKQLRDIVFFQRSLKPMEAGLCTLTEKRSTRSPCLPANPAFSDSSRS